MNPFSVTHAQDTAAALSGKGADSDAQFIAGGTDLLQLMQEGVVRSDALIDISRLPLAELEVRDDLLEIGALMRLRDLAEHEVVVREAPAIAQALRETASPQVRNMATVGGNLLQRTRCLYFRDAGAPCNKREPGSGCGAMDGCNRINAILGGSEHCIAAHPSDLAVALTALDAQVVVQGPDGERCLPIGAFYLPPGDTPEIENRLGPDELILAVRVPRSPAAARSRFIKLRDRETFEWALASCAVAFAIEDGRVADPRIVAGGVGTTPWRLERLESMLDGQALEPKVIAGVAECAADGAACRPGNAFKAALLREAVSRALHAGDVS